MRIILAWAVLLLSASAAQAQSARVEIAYLQMPGDTRYAESILDHEFQGQPWGRPIIGAEVALQESRFQALALGAEFSLRTESVKSAAVAAERVRQLHAEGIDWFLLDLPAALTAQLALATRDMDIALLNVSAPEDDLRQQSCQAHLLHTLASNSMRNDALAQYLTSHNWEDVLVLVGPGAADKDLAESWRRSARQHGLNIVDEREFLLGNDPRQREQNNVRLLTTTSWWQNYDVVYVADTQGEFARAAAYGVQRPRPVVGSGGLVAQDWHWAWTRFGAAQLNNRLEEQAGRRATAYDWAAWIAVKAIVEAMVRTRSTDFAPALAFMRGEEIVLDGFKGFRMGFRSWDNQLRQPILLATGNWVVERAPIEGFLHPVNYLDTLGFDPSESQCQMP